MAVDDNEHVERPRPVHTLDPVELDVAGRGRPADPGERAGGVEQRDGVGDVGDDLRRIHDADVEVGHEADRAAALVGLVVEHEFAVVCGEVLAAMLLPRPCLAIQQAAPANRMRVVEPGRLRNVDGADHLAASVDGVFLPHSDRDSDLGNGPAEATRLP